jgi:Flp pilus assembly pilin Flp
MLGMTIAQQRKLGGMLTDLVAPLRREEGQDLIEYALLCALMAVAVLTALYGPGDQIKGMFAFISNQLNNA